MATDASSHVPISSLASRPVKSAPCYGGRITSFVVFSSLVAASGGILFGFDLGISGGVTATGSFLQKFFPDVFEKMKGDKHISNYCLFNSQVLTAFTSSLYIAGVLASVIASHVTANYGRRTSMLIGSALFLSGSVMGGAAMDVYMLILSRVLLGFGVGFTNQVLVPPLITSADALDLVLPLDSQHSPSKAVPIYLSEMAPPRYRGAITGGFDASIVFGIFVANLINYGTQKIKSGWGWRISLSSSALPATFLLVGVIFLPDTPSSIIHRGGDIRVARRLLQRIRGTAEVDEELNDISVAAAAASKVAFPTNSFLLLLRRNYRPHLVMAITLPMFLNITGVSAVNFYAPVMFRTIGQNESSSLMSAVITRGISFVFTLTAALAAVDRIGRRTLYLTGGAVMVASHVALGTLLKEELRDHGTVSAGSAYAVVVIVCVFVAAFGWSWGPLTWLVTGEIFPMEIRSAGMSTMVIISFLMNFAVGQSLLAVLCGLKAGLFFLFGGGVVVMTAFVYWLVPETKGVPMEKMGSIWTEHWYWKRFVDHDMDQAWRSTK